MACDIDEIGGMYHGAVAAVRRNRVHALNMAPDSLPDYLSPTTVPHPGVRAVLITTSGGAWMQVPC